MASDRTRRKARTFQRGNGGKWKKATTLGVWALTLGAVAFSSEESAAPKGTPDAAAPETASCAPNVANGRGANAPFARLIDEMRRADGWKIFESSETQTVGSVAVEWEAKVGVGVGDEIPIAPPESAAVDASPTAQCSRWARFKPGSWARLRTTSVAYENGKTIRSVTETKISLTSVDLEKGEYELRFDATIKMGGLDYERKSRTARFDFYDVPLGDAAVETLAPANLTIARKAIPCQTRRVTRTTPQWKETTTLWFSPVVAPHVLQKETTRVAEDGETISRELSVVQKTAAHLLLGGELATYVVSSAAQKGTRFDSTTTVYSTKTPGGIARKTTVETDANGVVLLSSTTVALDYCVAP
ncbi:MAG: hypothetical protein IIW01_00125 [Thermoguttaceae bacterium]|nr:hypothetical protein [Thermoguttaceae bacterium]